MKTRSAFILIIPVVIVLNTSCIHYYYAPNSNNVPLFKEKNEARIQAGYSQSDYSSFSDEVITGFEMQTAYAFSKQFAAQLNFFSAGYSDDLGSGKGNYIEAAGGYYKAFGKKQWIFETYSGVGFGGVKNVYDRYYEASAKTSVTKFFIQPSFGYSRSRFSIAVASKFSLVNLGFKNSSLTKDAYPDDYDFVESLKNGRSSFCWEPSFMIRGGFKKVQLFSQAIFNVQSDKELPFCNENYSLGIIVPFMIKTKK